MNGKQQQQQAIAIQNKTLSLITAMNVYGNYRRANICFEIVQLASKERI